MTKKIPTKNGKKARRRSTKRLRPKKNRRSILK